MIDSRPLSTAFKLLTAITALLGIILQFASSADWTGMLSYYTMQSNIIVAIFYLVLVFSERPYALTESRDYSLAKGAITMSIMLTFIVYNIVLRPQFEASAAGAAAGAIGSMSGEIVHVITPLMVLADYLMFDLKGTYRFGDTLFWCIIPLLYPIYVAIYGACGGRFTSMDGVSSKYPYFFMDVDSIGALRVLGWMFLIIAGFVGLSMLYVVIDRVLGRLTRKADALAR